MNSLYQDLQPQQGPTFQDFMQNPIGALSKKYNIPQNLTDPMNIIQHLLNTNQITQQQVNSAMQRAGRR